jgi:hypothetical protein
MIEFIAVNAGSTPSCRIAANILGAKPRICVAMAAAVTKHLWEIGDIVDVLEAWEQSG